MGFVSGHGFSHAENGHENTGALAPERTPDAAPTDPIVQEQPTTFDTRTIDFKKYDPRFKELERLYSDCPDYGDRVRDAIRQIHEEEEQAWLATGYPS